MRSYLILTEVMVLVVQMDLTIYKTLWFYIRLLASSHKNAYIRFTAIKFYKNMQNRKKEIIHCGHSNNVRILKVFVEMLS